MGTKLQSYRSCKVIDHEEPFITSQPRHTSSPWIIEFRIGTFAKVTRGQNGEYGQLLPERVLLTTRNLREYFYTENRLSTPTLSTLPGLAGKIRLS